MYRIILSVVALAVGGAAAHGAGPKAATPAAGEVVCGKPCTISACVPEVSTTRTTRVYYDCERREYCLPKCSLPAWLCWWKGRGCGKADCCPKCGPPRARNVLIKKTATDEEETCRCVLKTIEPDCCAGEAVPATAAGSGRMK